MDDSKVTFNVAVTMNKRWVKEFVAFLKRLELDGSLGTSEFVAFYADGDGDFRPRFHIYGAGEEVATPKVGKLVANDCHNKEYALVPYFDAG